MIHTWEIKGWRRWDVKLDGLVQTFRKLYNTTPSLLVAHPVTLRRMAIAANRGHLRNAAGESPTGYAPLTGFTGADYSLLISEDAEVPEGHVRLIHVLDKEPKDIA